MESFHSTMFFTNTAWNIASVILKSAFFPPRLGNDIFLYFIIQVPIFCLPLSRQKLFFCWAQKKLNAHVSFFFSTMHTLLKSLLGKFDTKLGIWHQAFPAIKLWVNGSSLKLYPLRTFLSWSDHSMFAYCCEFSAPFQICRRAFSAFIY